MFPFQAVYNAERPDFIRDGSNVTVLGHVRPVMARSAFRAFRCEERERKLRTWFADQGPELPPDTRWWWCADDPPNLLPDQIDPDLRRGTA